MLACGNENLAGNFFFHVLVKILSAGQDFFRLFFLHKTNVETFSTHYSARA